MSRRLRNAALVMLLSVMCRDGLAEDTEAAPPYNFVVIMADDLGAGELACYGNAEHRTPRLDQLATEGTRFRTCWSTPICTPTRVLIMTGQYGFRTGYFHFLGRPYTPRKESSEYDIGSKTTFADVLGENGYATCAVGKWQLTGELPTLVNDCGFDEYCVWTWLHRLPPGAEHTGRREGNKPARFWHPGVLRNGELLETDADDYGPDIYCDYLIDFIQRHADEPFCAYYPMALTHTPWEPTPDLENPGQRTPNGLQANVEYADHLVGRIVDELDRLGLRERTIVIFTGDNGTQGNGKAQVTELGARVPLIVSCPGTVVADVVSDELSDLSDIFPTLLDYVGVDPPADHTLDGTSLRGTLEDTSVAHREWILSYLGDLRIVRDHRWLLRSDGRMLDNGDRRDGVHFTVVTTSNDAEVTAARERLQAVMDELPGPEGHPELRLP